MLLLLIILVWTVGLLMLAGLCFAARAGDRNLHSDFAARRGETPGPPAAARPIELHGSIERSQRSEPRELVA